MHLAAVDQAHVLREGVCSRQAAEVENTPSISLAPSFPHAKDRSVPSNRRERDVRHDTVRSNKPGLRHITCPFDLTPGCRPAAGLCRGAGRGGD